MTMTDTSARPSTRLLSGAAGITWVLGVTLVATQADTDPVGSGYDAANRSLTPALALLTASAVSLWRQRRGRAIGACAVGFALALAGNVMEFWVLWAAGGTTDAMATVPAAMARCCHRSASASSPSVCWCSSVGGSRVPLVPRRPQPRAWPPPSLDWL